MKKFLLSALLLGLTHLVMAQAFITTWQTDNTGVSNDDQIRIPGGGTYTIDWEEVGNPTNSGTAPGEGTTIVSFPSAGTYRVSISGGLTNFAFFNSGDSQKLLTIEQWGSITWASMNGAFWGCSNLTYNATDIPDLSVATDCTNMFFGCFVFNGDISNWDVSNIVVMDGMFSICLSFNANLSSWTVSNVTNMENMFFRAEVFNSNIGGWNVSNVTIMNGMFKRAQTFNQNITGWDVAMVNNMEGMFNEATSFNQDISSWTVSNVTTMKDMFNAAVSFNQDISGWTVSNVNNMEGMFSDANSFDQNIGSWDISNVTTMENMLDFSGLSIINYDNTLIGWSAQSVQSSVVLTAENLAYCNGETARNSLINSDGWNISLDAIDCGALPVELISFVGKEVANGIELRWKTASEINNSGFEIERSDDGEEWELLGFVRGEGTTSLFQNYTYTDRRPLQGYNYYRLKQIDFDGRFEYSEALAIARESDNGSSVEIYPNPSNGLFTLRISNPSQESVSIKLYDNTGRLIWNEQFGEEESMVEWERQFDLPRRSIYFFHTQVGDKLEASKVSMIRED